MDLYSVWLAAAIAFAVAVSMAYFAYKAKMAFLGDLCAAVAVISFVVAAIIN